jgi:hypothetical protein
MCPAALDALAAALDRSPRFVSGALHRTRGGVVIDPIAVVVDGALVVPDLAAGDGSASLDLAAPAATDPLTGALESATALLAEAAHRGLRHLPATFADRLRGAAAALDRVGLRRSGASVAGVAATLGPDPGPPAVTAWADALVRLLVTTDCR